MITLNIDMPKCCDECPISVELFGDEIIGACPITHTWGTNHDKERYENCPLSELKGENKKECSTCKSDNSHENCLGCIEYGHWELKGE